MHVSEQKKAAGERAADYVKDGMILGLGTGSTAYYATLKIGERVADGLRVQAVATSRETERLAASLGIPLLRMDEAARIDLAIDGVDEIDGEFNAIKGGGGALFREKMVAGLAAQVIWVMDGSKLVDKIGAFPLAVEISPFGCAHVMKKLEAFSTQQTLRVRDGAAFVTDNGNHIADIVIRDSLDLQELAQNLKSITGVLESGLFLNMCDRIIAATETGVQVIENKNKGA